jgi:hypothetical protein
VLIHNFFGATEFGIVNFASGKWRGSNCSFHILTIGAPYRDIPDTAKPYSEGYEWFKFAPIVSLELIPEEGEEGVYELVFKVRACTLLSSFQTHITPA